MGIVSKITGRGDSLAEIDREITKHVREVMQAGAGLETAKLNHAELFSSGTDDDIDAAARDVLLAERRVARAALRRDALAAERATLAAQARADLERRLLGLAIAAGAAHAKNARAAAESAAEYLTKRFALEQAGFHRAANELASMPQFVLDLSNSVGPNAVARAVHPLVERFAFDLETLARKSIT